jgi:hypothetical protein
MKFIITFLVMATGGGHFVAAPNHWALPMEMSASRKGDHTREAALVKVEAM